MVNYSKFFWIGILSIFQQYQSFAKEVSELNSDSVAHIVRVENLKVEIATEPESKQTNELGRSEREKQLENSEQIRSNYKQLEAIKNSIRELWGVDADKMIRIINCESNWNVYAYNPETEAKRLGITKFSSCGLAQINSVECQPNESPLYDWKYNLDRAFEKYQERGFQPWKVCSRKENVYDYYK